MKLYSGPVSLFSRKVEIALHEKGLSFERIQVPFSQTRGYAPKDPAVLAANPKGQVPVFVDGDLVLYDSTVIVEYLEDAYPTPALFPKAPQDKARCRLLDVFADEVMLAAFRALMHRTEPHEADDPRFLTNETKAREAEPVDRGPFCRRSSVSCQGKDLSVRQLLRRRHCSLHGGVLGRRLGGPLP